jgi:RecA-family ATPase
MSKRELVPLESVNPASVNWLWTGRIPLGGITLLDGDPGDGKSTVMYDLAARVTAGRPMPLEETSSDAAGVVLLQAEDSVATTVRPCIEAAGGDLGRIFVYNRKLFADQPLSLPNDSKLIATAIEAVEAKLVVIDPLAAFLAGSSNSESTIRKALSGLAVIAETNQVAVVIVRHLTKGRSANTKYRGSGSIGIIGAARSALMVADDPTSNDPHQHVLALNKSNLSDASSLIYRTYKQGDATRVRWLGESPHGVRQLSESAANQFEHSQLEEACYVLYTILSEVDDAVPAKEVQQRAKEALVSQRTLMRAKKKMGVTSRRVAEEDSVRWVWELPEDRSALVPYKERSSEPEPPEEHPESEPTSTDDWNSDVLDEEFEFETCETSGGRPWDD